MYCIIICLYWDSSFCLVMFSWLWTNILYIAVSLTKDYYYFKYYYSVGPNNFDLFNISLHDHFIYRD